MMYIHDHFLMGISEKINYKDYLKFLDEEKECIICGKNEKIVWTRYSGFKAVQCNGCKFVWIDPCLNKEGLEKYYHDYLTSNRKNKEMARLRKIQYKIDLEFIKKYIQKGKVLDVGCSGGFFLNEFGDGFKKHGIEIDPESCNYGRKEFGINIMNGIFGEKDDFRENYFDLVVTRGSIEHMPNARQVIERIAKVLKPGGFYFISATPNIECFSAQIYKEKWNQFDPIEHIFYFSEKTMSNLCNQHGLKLIDSDYPYLKTPYANPYEDNKKIIEDVLKISNSKKNEITASPPFWGTMMTLIFQK